MLQPFQCILVCSRLSGDPVDVIIVASGSSIFSFDASNGLFLSGWPQEHKADTKSPTYITDLDTKTNSQEQTTEPPGKRQKLSTSGDVSDSSSAEIVVENGHGKARTPRDKGKAIHTVIKVIGTSDGKYLVAVTGGDKCIRVFRLLENGSLEQISQRYGIFLTV